MARSGASGASVDAVGGELFLLVVWQLSSNPLVERVFFPGGFMWDGLSIGARGRSPGTSAMLVTALGGGHGISENSVCYWISGGIFGMYCRIFKDHPAGEEIANAIARGSLKEAMDAANRAILANASLEMVQGKLRQVEESAYEKGRRDQATIMRRALMLGDDA